MHRIMNMLQGLVDELFAIKNFESEIELQEALDFYNWYFATGNDLVTDIIRAKLTALNAKDMPISENDISAIIEVFSRYNKYEYNMFVIDALSELCTNGSVQAYEYLNKILDTDEKKTEFEKDFGKTDFGEQAKKNLIKLGK